MEEFEVISRVDRKNVADHSTIQSDEKMCYLAFVLFGYYAIKK